MDFSDYKDYYLIKCFSNDKYREDFNSGENIHLNSCQYFHKVENDFQKDMEGVILSQDEGADGYLLVPHIDIKQLINDYNSGIRNKDINIMQIILHNSEVICKTENFISFINGYLCCFYIIKKNQVIFNGKGIHFPNEKDYYDFVYFLKRYSDEKDFDKGYAYVSVYDAEPLLTTLCDEMYSKGYNYTNGFVEYENLSQEKKIKYFNEKNIYKIAFTKNKLFDYQKEFRILFSPKNHSLSDFIEEKICPLSKSVVKSFVYLSYDFCREKGIKK